MSADLHTPFLLAIAYPYPKVAPLNIPCLYNLWLHEIEKTLFYHSFLAITRNIFYSQQQYY